MYRHDNMWHGNLLFLEYLPRVPDLRGEPDMRRHADVCVALYMPRRYNLHRLEHVRG